MQTILGANGVIAQELSKHLPGYTDKIRQVSRHPNKVNPSDELMSADLLNFEQTEKAVAGSERGGLARGPLWQSLRDGLLARNLGPDAPRRA